MLHIDYYKNPRSRTHSEELAIVKQVDREKFFDHFSSEISFCVAPRKVDTEGRKKGKVSDVLEQK